MNRLNLPFRRRLAGLISLLVLGVAGCAVLARLVTRDARGTVGQLADVELESARLARQFRGGVNELHGALQRLGGETGAASAAVVAGRRAMLSVAPAGVAGPGPGGRSVSALCREAIEAARRGPGSGAIVAVLAAVEWELLTQAHAATAGNITQMAQLLGWSRLTVREKLKLHGLRPMAAGESA